MHPGKVPFAQGLEEYVSLQLLLIEEESRVGLGKGERTGADDKERPECDKFQQTVTGKLWQGRGRVKASPLSRSNAFPRGKTHSGQRLGL